MVIEAQFLFPLAYAPPHDLLTVSLSLAEPALLRRLVVYQADRFELRELRVCSESFVGAVPMSNPLPGQDPSGPYLEWDLLHQARVRVRAHDALHLKVVGRTAARLPFRAVIHAWVLRHER